MGKLRWYKRDPVAALEGMSDLTLEERGAYNTVLDLIYARDGKVDDDDRFIAGWLRCDLRVWRRIKVRLIDRKKLYSDCGTLRNSRADAEVSRGLSMVASASEAGKASALSKLAANNKNNDIPATTVATVVSTNSTTTTTEDIPSLRSGARSKRVRARVPIPDDWKLDEIDLAYGHSRGFVDQQMTAMGRSFENHHRGKGNLMADWRAAWRTWCENEIKFNRPMPGVRNGPQRKTVHDAARDLTANVAAAIKALDEPAPELCDDAGRNTFRLLPSG